MSKEIFDVVILGAGMAGLAAADALIQNNLTCSVVDINEPGSGTSGAPLMLLNPATGRRARMSWRAEESMNATLDLLQRVQKEAEDSFFEMNGVIRPALTPELATNFQRSPEKYDWPEENWVTWLDKEHFAREYPVFKNHHGGLVVRNAATINGDLFMKFLSSYLMNLGVKTYYHRSWVLESTTTGWNVILDDGNSLAAKHILFALGHSVSHSPYWDFLPLHFVKGQLIDLYFETSLPLKNSVSGMGYMAYMQKYPNRLVVGSTYEHNYTNLQPDEHGLKYLRKKLDAVLPGILSGVQATEQWTGVRVTTPDRKPVVGEHPELKGLFVFTALGSKGLITARYAAEMLAQKIAVEKPLEKELSIQRFL